MMIIFYAIMAALLLLTLSNKDNWGGFV